MSRSTLILAGLLGVSLVVHALTIPRLSRSSVVPAFAKNLRPEVRAEGDGPAPLHPPAAGPDGVRAEVSLLRRELAEVKEMLRSGPREAGLPIPSVENGSSTRVETVLTEQRQIDGFWDDLETLSEAKGQFDGETYAQMILDHTVDHLGLAEPARTQFLDFAREVLPEALRHHREYREAVRAAREKDDSVQHQAVRNRFREQLKPVRERLQTVLNMSHPRNKRFSAELSSWLAALSAPSGSS